MKKNNSYIKYISLIEIVIALAIFAVAFAPLFLMLTSSKKGMKSGEGYFRSILLAEKVMEEVSSFIYFCPQLKLPSKKEYRAFPDHKIRIKRKLLDDEFFQVNVIVQWKEQGKEDTREVSLSSAYSVRAASVYSERIEYPWDKDE